MLLGRTMRLGRTMSLKRPMFLGERFCLGRTFHDSSHPWRSFPSPPPQEKSKHCRKELAWARLHPSGRSMWTWRIYSQISSKTGKENDYIWKTDACFRMDIHLLEFILCHLGHWDIGTRVKGIWSFLKILSISSRKEFILFFLGHMLLGYVRLKGFHFEKKTHHYTLTHVRPQGFYF